MENGQVLFDPVEVKGKEIGRDRGEYEGGQGRLTHLLRAKMGQSRG